MNDSALENAFSGLKCPKGDRLLHFEFLDNSDVAFLFPHEGQCWSEIDHSVLIREASCLTSLSDDGLLFVIPAYLAEFLRPSYDDYNGWVDRLLEVLSTKGRGELVLSPNQYEFIDKNFLTPLAKDWEKYGRGGTCFGGDWGEFIKQARSHYAF